MKSNIIINSFFATAIFDTSAAIEQWQQVTGLKGSAVQPRYFHGGGFFADKYYAFNGQGSSGSLNTFMVIDLKTLQVSDASVVGDGRLRAGYTMTSTGSLYAHGGMTNILLKDFFLLASPQSSWDSLNTGPSARSSHCLEYDTVQNRVILFGGADNRNSLNDVWVYGNDNWNQITPTSSIAITGRYLHACTFNSSNGGMLFVHGGLSDAAKFKDLWQFEINARQWKPLHAGFNNLQLSAHAMIYVQQLNTLFLFLGYNSITNTVSSFVYQYDLNSRSWSLALQGNPSLGRYCFSAGYNPETTEYYVFGGIRQQSGILGDLWKIRLVSPAPPAPSPSLLPLPPVNVEYPSSPISSPITSPSPLPPIIATSSLQKFSVSLSLTVVHNKSSSGFKVLPRSSSLATNESQTNPVITFLSNFWYFVVAGFVGIFILALLHLKFTKRRPQRRRSKARPTASQHQGLPPINFIESSNHAEDSMSSVSQSSATMTFEITEHGLSLPGYLMIDPNKDFKYKSMLTSGGYGLIYVADAIAPHLQSYGKQVAVKQFKQDKVSDDNEQKFNLEVSLMEYFKKNRNIAKILGYSDKPFCIVMKFYNRGNLSGFINKLSRSIRKYSVRFSKDISCALQCMHDKGVIHNDLKPDNVMIDNDPITGPFCVLTDFGISQVVRFDILKVKALIAPEVRAASILYAAPDRMAHYRNNAKANLPEAIMLSWDVYALGITTCHLITGEINLIFAKERK